MSTAAPKLTVLIPCKDERRNIRPCIESARPVADEILVADSGSTDGTLAIVHHVGACRLIRREYVSYGDFLNWAIPQAGNPWVLVVDADERLTEPLAAEIRDLFRRGPTHDGYWIRRANYFLGHRIRFSGWQHDRVLRLFRRDLGRCADTGDHVAVAIPTGNVGRLRARLVHYTYRSYDQYLRKLERYTSQQAEAWHRQGRRASLLDMLAAGPLRFLRSYLLQLGFLDGMAGLQVCALTGFYSFLKRARLWELDHARPQPGAEAEPPVSLRRAARGRRTASIRPSGRR